MGLFRRLRFSPWLVQIVPTRRCNLHCAYCNEYDSSSAPVPLDIMRVRLEKLRELGAFSVEFSGGEPLLHPDIVELVRYCTRLGFLKRMLISNGFLLTERIIRQLNEAGLTDLQVSVDGVEPTSVTIKTLKPLRKKLERLARLARFRVTVNAVIGSAPPEEVKEVVSFAKQHRFRITIGLIHDENGSLSLTEEQMQLYRELKQKVRLSYRPGSDYINDLLLGRPAPFKCRAGSRYLYVDENGLAHYCSQQRDIFAKELLSYCPADLEEQFYKHKRCSAWCTIGCVRATSAPDRWRRQKAYPKHQVSA